MHALIAIALAVFWSCTAFSQDVRVPGTFDVASVKPSPRAVGKDANNRVSIGATGFSGRNVTLKRLILEAYGLQPHQVAGGPNWLDGDEYDIEARADGPTAKEQLRLMLRPLLADRFRLSFHSETKELNTYELVIDKNGPKIQPAAKAGAAGLRSFHGDLQQFANLLSIQLTIPVMDDPGRPGMARGAPVPVIDKTGLSGIYDIPAEIRPELGGDMFTLWQRVLQDRLGLKLESRKSKVEVLVVDRAERTPTAN